MLARTTCPSPSSQAAMPATARRKTVHQVVAKVFIPIPPHPILRRGASAGAGREARFSPGAGPVFPGTFLRRELGTAPRALASGPGSKPVPRLRSAALTAGVRAYIPAHSLTLGVRYRRAPPD